MKLCINRNKTAQKQEFFQSFILCTGNTLHHSSKIGTMVAVVVMIQQSTQTSRKASTTSNTEG